MTRGEEEPKKGEGKGFAGLSSLVSDVDTMPVLPGSKKEPAAAASVGHVASQPTQQQPPTSQQQQTDKEPADLSSTGKWALAIAIAVIFGAFWLFDQASKRATTSLVPSYPLPAESTAPDHLPLAPAPVTSQPQVPSRPTESKPPVGQGLLLSNEQIRYCLAEDIRMDAAKSALNNYSDYDVDIFNSMVADYNSRCGSFRYRSGALEGVRREIEPYRSLFQSEGQSRFAPAPTDSLSTPTPAQPVSNSTVQAIQSKLNELGYEAGTADGLMGRRTRSAILAFQRDSGLVADGNATDALLQLLTASAKFGRHETQVSAPSVEARHPTNIPPVRTLSLQESIRPNDSGIPKNASLSYLGDSWRCDRGYYREGNECAPVSIPANASLNYFGDDWSCNSGYYREGNECAPVYIPTNASLNYFGNDWECNQGFRRFGNRCVSISQQ